MPANKSSEVPRTVRSALRLVLYLPPCPKCEGSDTFVFCTRGRTRHCKCRDCGWTFRVLAQPSEQLLRLIPRNRIPQIFC